MRRLPFGAWLFSALLVGGLIAWIDTRPNWDDTSVTVGLILLASAGFGAARPDKAWLAALAIGAWLPLLYITRTGNPLFLLILGLAFAGAYAGALVRVMLRRIASAT
jgi:hypothetical protein